MTEFELVWDSRCGVAESPVWDASTRRLLFCDIPGKRINALSVDDGAHTSWDFPEVVGSFGLCRSGRIVVALRHRVVLFDPRTKAIEQLTDPVNEPPTNRLNDGKVGPDGCFWVGSMDENSPRQKTAALYRVTPQGRIERKADGYAVSNGLAWSPDGNVMYHSDFDRRHHRGMGLRRAERGAYEPPRAGDIGQRGGAPRRRCRRHRRCLLVGWTVRGLHQPHLAVGCAVEQAAVPGSRPDHAVLRGRRSLRDVAARGPLA